MLHEILVYNTLTRTKEVFEPFDKDIVRMYVCGPTVYDETHLGHLRTYVAFDCIKKYLEIRGYRVIHVQNITDIDDKIIRRAHEEGVDWREIADRYTRDYLEVLEKFDIKPWLNPRVTMHISDIIEFIKILIEKGYAYESNGSVYFNVDSYEHYGELSGTKDRTAWRQELDVLAEKKNPYDFALWKKAKPGEPWWESPWGPGRPGWHIECSVMATKYLGSRIDIHGGGQDLIFPHHENEKAQSEAALGVRPWVKYWLHTGMLSISGEKMSKSLGNIITVKEALKKYKPGVLRTWILSAHYRSQLEFREDSLEQARSVHRRVINALKSTSTLLSKAEGFNASRDELEALNLILKARTEFHKAMSNDFNTSVALSNVLEAVSIYNKMAESNPNIIVIHAFREFIREANYVFGFTVGEEEWRIGVNEKFITDLIEAIIDARRVLREKKMYEVADYIRSRLEKIGVKLVDKGLETRYYIERRE